MHILDQTAGLAFDIAEPGVEPHRHVSAANVEPYSGNADLIFIGDDAANRLRVAQMTIRANHPGDDISDRHAVLHLRNGRIVMAAENLQWAALVLNGLRSDSDVSRDGFGFARQLLLACRVAERAPR